MAAASASGAGSGYTWLYTITKVHSTVKEHGTSYSSK